MPAKMPPSSESADLRDVSLDETLRTLTSRLLDARTPRGQWEGHLASSALATATAIVALTLVDARQHADLIRGGLTWLADHQNADGGWGDTVLSRSNISTTLLCWSACTIADESQRPRETIAAAERWLRQAAGGLEPERLIRAIVQRYGKDRTFSVPILTVLALAGRLGDGRGAWARVPQLPFELAVCPHRWFQWLRLPVVSYALPALIAIGQVRHHHRPTRNPVTRALRAAARAKTLCLLEAIQPSSGGYLEAVPLTAFVSMSLAASGQARHAVVRGGVRFLSASVREDGSWPIDTNLATWVTTLSINALMHAADSGSALDADARTGLTTWLLGQQYRVEHPYTHAAPGGWAWTDLPGGVPDADDTSGALLALRSLVHASDARNAAATDERQRAALDAARLGVRWLLDLQNRDGGIPTFCRGWGALPFDRSTPDLTAHALLAWNAWRDALPAALQADVDRATTRALRFLEGARRDDGGWIPLWFGNEQSPDEESPTYGTARVLIALARMAEPRSPESRNEDAASRGALADRAAAWLLRAQNADGGWGGACGVVSSIEESALAVDALSAYLLRFHASGDGDARPADPAPAAAAIASAVARGVTWLAQATDRGRHTPASPIGLYFAKLWYFETLYPLAFSVSALGRARAARDAAASDSTAR